MRLKLRFLLLLHRLGIKKFKRTAKQRVFDKLFDPGLKKSFELSYQVRELISEGLMISPGTGCRRCLFKVSTELDYDTDIATCPKCKAKYAVIHKDHHDMETGEIWQDINLGEQLYDFPTPKNFQNPMGEKKK